MTSEQGQSDQIAQPQARITISDTGLYGPSFFVYFGQGSSKWKVVLTISMYSVLCLYMLRFIILTLS